mgnify:CR=1 FL=1
MNQFSNLKLQSLAIGSLPHNDVNKAMLLVEKDFSQIPFFPQLANISKNEDMIIQILEGLPSFLPSNTENIFIDSESDKFFEDLEEFFTDYEEIIGNPESELLEKYGISEDFSSTFPYLEEIIKKSKPDFAKGQVAGPFTLAAALTDKEGKSAVFDETLRDIILKLLSLKVLWQIKRIKRANAATVPIIFMDEPSMSQLGTSAYLTVSEQDVVEMLSEIVDLIHDNGGISAIHCCGKCDWSIPIKAGVDIVNFDAYAFSEHFSLYHKEIKGFLEKGGKIAWGLVPTLDSDALEKITIDSLVQNFENSVKYLTNKDIDEKLITDNSLITSSCGAGTLTVELAEYAMDLVFELSNELRKRF